ncbi:MAG: hypothetical protein ACXIUB_00160 [Wenzhouxiangella sp.]
MSIPEKTRPANPWWQRWQRQWRAWRGAGEGKTHRVQLVERDGQRFKRVIFDAADTANQCAKLLTELAPMDRFVPLHRHQECVVEVGFIDGPLATSGRDEAGLQAFFVDLYAGQHADQVSLAASSLMTDLSVNLDFLVDHRRLDQAGRDALWQAAQCEAPDRLWLGADYIDPVLKNFVRRHDQRIVAIDIEALVGGLPLGSGLAKARLRWMRDEPSAVFTRVEAAGGPDLSPQYRVVELAFLAGYFRQKIIQKKPRHLHLPAFDRWLAG